MNYLIRFTKKSPPLRVTKNDPRNAQISEHLSTAQVKCTGFKIVHNFDLEGTLREIQILPTLDENICK